LIDRTTFGLLIKIKLNPCTTLIPLGGSYILLFIGAFPGGWHYGFSWFNQQLD